MGASPKLALAFAIPVFAFVLYRPIERHVSSAKLLARLNRDGHAESSVVPPRLQESTPSLPKLAKYGPAPEDARLTIVLAHGIHHAGIHEPRLRKFAAALAALDCHVITPEISSLARYEISAEGTKEIQRTVLYAAKRSERVGLIGFSFAGALSLLAAREPNVASSLSYVASLGGYLDLHRTLRFLATNRVTSPEGEFYKESHEYGLIVLLLSELDSFQLGEDRATIHSLLLSWLGEQKVHARLSAKKLVTPLGRKVFELLNEGRLQELAGRIAGGLAKKKSFLTRLSPGGRLQDVQTKMLFLHGRDDSVIPSEEVEFAAAELKRKGLQGKYLVTPLLEHARLGAKVDWEARLQLLHFVAEFL